MSTPCFSSAASLRLLASFCLAISLAGCSGGGGGSSTTTTTTTTTPPPTTGATLAISAVSPTDVPVGAGDTPLVVTGTGFTSASVISLNGIAEATTFVSSTEIHATAPAAQLKTGAVLSIAVANGSTTVTADAKAVALSVDNPVPSLASVSPANVTVGSTAASVTVTGTKFVPGVALSVNGTTRDTTYVSDTQLTANLTAADFAAAGTLPLNVINPKPGGGTSGTSSFTVNNPAPTVTSLSPSTAVQSSTPPTVTVTGTNFVAGSSVVVNGATRATTVVSGTQLKFTLTTADLANATTLPITVSNPAPGGGTSSSVALTVTAKTGSLIAISSVNPSSLYAYSGDTVIAVRGSGFSQASKILWNGTALTTTYLYGYDTSVSPAVWGPYLSGFVSSNLLKNAGPVSIVVLTGTTSSAATTLTINPAPVPTITNVLTSALPVGKDAVGIQINGTFFTPNSTASLNGVNLPITASYGTQLDVTIPAAAVITPGIKVLRVTNITGASDPAYLTAYVPIPNNSMIYSSATGLFYLSVPSSAGALYGNSIVPVDPITGGLGTPIPVGSEPDRMAITADGHYAWVALDGAAAVRKVDLIAGSAGLQFSITHNSNSTYRVAALAAIPGQSDSVVISTGSFGYSAPSGDQLVIYDAGIPRATTVQFQTYGTYPNAMIVDSTSHEIYGPGSQNQYNGYQTYQYDSTGVSKKNFTATALSYSAGNTDEIQLDGGRMYTDYGQVVDPETGSLLGSFSLGGTTPRGPVAVDHALGKAFVLTGAGIGSNVFQLAAFGLSDLQQVAPAAIPIYLEKGAISYTGEGPSNSRLTRWGVDGLAFRTSAGFFSVRTNLVKDVSNLNADLGVKISPVTSAVTGASTTYSITVTNQGTATATGVQLTGMLPSGGLISSLSVPSGICSQTPVLVCNLGDLPNGASLTARLGFVQTVAGNSTLSFGVSASQNDPSLADNAATVTTVVGGSTLNLAPALIGVVPAAIAAGSGDTTVTITGNNFSNTSVVYLDGSALSTQFTSSTQLTAIVPSSSLRTLGWGSLSVSNPAPGGGSSSRYPLSVFSVMAAGANRLLYEPFSRQVLASVGAGGTGFAANSIVSIDPASASVVSSLPAGGTPTGMAETSDGGYLYALLPSEQTGSIGRYNLLSRSKDFVFSGLQATGYNVGLRDLATQPGSETTLAVDEGEYEGVTLFDVNPAAKSATRRATSSGIYSGTCLAFSDANHLLFTDLYSSGTYTEMWSVTNGGLSKLPGAVLQNMDCFKVKGSQIFGHAGGVGLIQSTSIQQTGTLPGIPLLGSPSGGGGVRDFDPDPSLGLSYVLTSSNSDAYDASFDSLSVYSLNTFERVFNLPIPLATIEPASPKGVDVVRWGADGLAFLTSSGRIYLLRGGAVVPQLLNTNTAAVLTASSSTSITHGAGNTLLTLTGSNFIPGVAVTWNGSYRTTTIVDATHVTVAIPASDLAAAGTAHLVATNPGAPASSPLTFTVQ